MARDRNVTVWQAYVTVMSIVSFLCLGALAYMMFTSGTNLKTAEAAIKDKRDAEANLRKVTERNQLLQSILGVGKPISEAEFNQLKSSVTGDPEIDAAVKTYTNHMGLFGVNEPEKNYAKLVDTLMQELRSRNIALSNAAAKAIQDTENYDRKIKVETDLRVQAQQEKEQISLKAKNDLDNYTAKIAEQVKAFEALAAQKLQQFREFQDEKGKLNAKIAEATRRNEEQARRIDSLVQKINEVQNESFQTVQGEITDVQVSKYPGDGPGQVWINLGRADGLRPGVNFVVFDSDVTQASQGKVKAKIEIVEVLAGAEHLSRAKILDDRAFTAILRGDKVYSPFWQPGSKVQIALLGKIDFDGDGKDDRDRIKGLLDQNQVTLAMDMLPTGEVTGQLTEKVRWLVVGEELKYRVDEEGKRDPAMLAASKRRRDIETQARSLGITIINPNNLMSWLQVGADSSPLGDAARPRVDEYRPRVPRGIERGKVSEIYQSTDGRLNRNTPPE